MTKPDSIHCRPGVTDAMERLAAENERLKSELLAAQIRAADSADEAHKWRLIAESS